MDSFLIVSLCVLSFSTGLMVGLPIRYCQMYRKKPIEMVEIHSDTDEEESEGESEEESEGESEEESEGESEEQGSEEGEEEQSE